MDTPGERKDSGKIFEEKCSPRSNGVPCRNGRKVEKPQNQKTPPGLPRTQPPFSQRVLTLRGTASPRGRDPGTCGAGRAGSTSGRACLAKARRDRPCSRWAAGRLCSAQAEAKGGAASAHTHPASRGAACTAARAAPQVHHNPTWGRPSGHPTALGLGSHGYRTLLHSCHTVSHDGTLAGTLPMGGTS